MSGQPSATTVELALRMSRPPNYSFKPTCLRHAASLKALAPLERDSQTDAWILYAFDMAAGRDPATRQDISLAADAINHAVPTQQELDGSLEWLQHKDLIEVFGRRYSLSPCGRDLAASARSGASTVSAVWANFTQALRHLSAGA